MGFDMMQIRLNLLLDFSSIIEDVNLNEFYWCFGFDGWLLVLFCPRMMSSHIWRLIILFFGCFWCSILDWVHWTSFLPFKSFPVEFPRLDPSFPKLGPFPPKQGFLLLTPILRYFFPQWVFYSDLDVKESIPIEPQVFVHPFATVLGLVTFQLP
jgi:hypothetical protein